jgi:hypothetical protein
VSVGVARVRVPVLSKTTAVMPHGALERLGVAKEHPATRGAPDAHDDGRRRREAEGARAGHHEHRHRAQ